MFIKAGMGNSWDRLQIWLDWLSEGDSSCKTLSRDLFGYLEHIFSLSRTSFNFCSFLSQSSVFFNFISFTLLFLSSFSIHFYNFYYFLLYISSVTFRQRFTGISCFLLFYRISGILLSFWLLVLTFLSYSHAQQHSTSFLPFTLPVSGVFSYELPAYSHEFLSLFLCLIFLFLF